MDVWYVDNQSFLLDLKILYLTVCKIIRREDIAPEDGLMPPFKGNTNEDH